MKILSKKRYEDFQQAIFDLRADLVSAKNDEKNYLEQIELFNKALNESNINNKSLKDEIEKLKNENKRLKILLSKNKIEYKKEDNKKIEQRTKKKERGKE